MTPGVRRLALTAHIACSVGWLGAVVAFIAVAVVGWTSRDAITVRGAYLLMEPVTWYVVVPLGLASVLTGLVSALGTAWGLFRHYWPLVKFGLTLAATAVLLLYTRTVGGLAGAAADPGADPGALRSASPVLHATLAVPVLLAATALGVFKPRGTTRYGRRRQRP